MLCLTVMEWQDNNMKALFANFLNENYKTLDVVSVTGQANKFMQTLKQLDE